MNVLLFGATGMVGQGALRECLLDPDVGLVETVGRTPTGVQNAKLREIVRRDLFDYGPVAAELCGFDACFFCLGVTSRGLPEADYHRVTYELTLAAADTLVRLNPQMTLVFVSGAGSDSTERGPLMWARVKGKTENAPPSSSRCTAFDRRPPCIATSTPSPNRSCRRCAACSPIRF